MDASVGFEDGVASRIEVFLTVGKADGKGDWREDTGVVVRQSTTKIRRPCNQHDRLNVQKRYGVDDRHWATIGMDSCVLPDERARAIAINSGCLTRIGGCKTVEEMLPHVFGQH